MKKLAFVMFCFVLGLTSCSKDTIEIIGVEVSGTYSLNGKYMHDKTFTKGTQYVSVTDETLRLKTAIIDNKDMWILIRGNVYYYKIVKDGAYPPQSGWECGYDVDKEDFKCELIID